MQLFQIQSNFWQQETNRSAYSDFEMNDEINEKIFRTLFL